MTMHTLASASAALAIAAAMAPMVCQAQAPGSFQQKVVKLIEARDWTNALAEIDKCISAFGPDTRLGKQFYNQLGWFYYKKGECLLNIGQGDAVDYNGALEAFEKCAEDKEFSDIVKNPFRFLALYKMGETEFKRGSYEDALKFFTEYLNRKGQRPKDELDANPQPIVHNLMSQCYISKETPDIEKGMEYLRKSMATKGEPIPDNYVVGGVNNLIKTAMRIDRPEVAYNVLSEHPEVLDLGATRIAMYVPAILNLAVEAGNKGREAAQAGDMKKANNYNRLALLMYGFIPTMQEIKGEISGIAKSLGALKAPIKDGGARYNVDQLQNTLKKYDEWIAGKKIFDAFSLAGTANIYQGYGSMRTARAAYELLEDRYNQMEDRETYLFQLAMTTYQIDPTRGEVIINKHMKDFPESKFKKDLSAFSLERLITDKKYTEALEQASKVLDQLQGDTKNPHYAMAAYVQIAANFQLGQGNRKYFANLIEPAKAFLKDFPDHPNYSKPALFFLGSAESRTGYIEDAIKTLNSFMEKYPSTDPKDPYMPNVLFDQVYNYYIHGQEGDKAKSLEFCDRIIESYPDHAVMAPALMMKGNLLVQPEKGDPDVPGALEAYQKSYEAAIAKKNKSTAGEALYNLASYTNDLKPAEGTKPEDDAAAKKAKILDYSNKFWAECDMEGHPFSLQMGVIDLQLNNKDKAAFDKALKHLQELIVREANIAQQQNRINPQVERAVGTYTKELIESYKTFQDGKELSADEVKQHFDNFPGVSRDNKTLRSILMMAVIGEYENMRSNLARPKDMKDKQAVETYNNDRQKLTQAVDRSLFALRDEFKPADLTDYACTWVGDKLVAGVESSPNRSAKEQDRLDAITYYQKVADNKNSEYRAQAALGLARAFGLSSSASDVAKGVEMMQQALASARKQEVPDRRSISDVQSTLVKLLLQKGSYKEALTEAQDFLNSDRNNVPMSNMQAEAYEGLGDLDNAILTYANLYNTNIARVSVSAPACEKAMILAWKRNKPASGTAKSDKLFAYDLGEGFIRKMKGNFDMMSGDDQDKFRAVEKLVEQYRSDSTVQNETKERRRINAELERNKNR